MIAPLRRIRNATGWPAVRARMREAFLVSSWAEYERLEARTTVTDSEVLARVEDLHAGPGKPDVRSYLGHRLRRPRSSAS